jgi:hypothetical protein
VEAQDLTVETLVPIELFDTYFDHTRVGDFETLVSHYRKSEFEPPFCSTIPLLSFVRDKTILNELTARCAFSSRPAFHFQFRMPLPLGSGKPSRTDLMLTDNEQRATIDARWTEPPYELVKHWLGPSPTTNRRDVLSGWLGLLNRQAAVPVTHGAAAEISYRLLSRAAAMCNSGGALAQICYLRFRSKQQDNPALREVLRDDLVRLRNILGRSELFQFRLFEADIAATPAFHKLTELPRRSKRSALAVRQALVSETLFSFAGLRDVAV